MRGGGPVERVVSLHARDRDPATWRGRDADAPPQTREQPIPRYGRKGRTGTRAGWLVERRGKRPDAVRGPPESCREARRSGVRTHGRDHGAVVRTSGPPPGRPPSPDA